MGKDTDEAEEFRIGDGPHIYVGIIGGGLQIGVAIRHVVGKGVPEFEDDELRQEERNASQPPDAVRAIVPKKADEEGGFDADRNVVGTCQEVMCIFDEE